MQQIFAISTVIKQIDHLFEGWYSNEDDNFKSFGFLKEEYLDSEFSVHICLDTEYIVELDNKFFPHVELYLSTPSTHEALSWEQVSDGSPFSMIDVLNGWYNYDWLRDNEKIDHSRLIALALDLSNKIRMALSIPSLSQFNQEESNSGFIY